MDKKLQTSWGFFISPNSIFEAEELNTYEKICYLYLCRCGDNDKKSFPSYERIADKTGVSRRTAMRAIKSLEEKGYIVVKRRKTDKRKNTSNLYTLLQPEEVTGDCETPEQKCVVSESHHISSDRESPSLVSESHPINTHIINTHIINTQQQQELEKRVVVVQEKYESLFEKKLTKKQAIDLISLADKHEVDVLHKIKNTHEMHCVEPRTRIVGAIKFAIANGDWEISSKGKKKISTLTKAVAGQVEVKKTDEEELEITRQRVEKKLAEMKARRKSNRVISARE